MAYRVRPCSTDPERWLEPPSELDKIVVQEVCQKCWRRWDCAVEMANEPRVGGVVAGVFILHEADTRGGANYRQHQELRAAQIEELRDLARMAIKYHLLVEERAS